jgi:hypothetical protein
MRLLLLVSGVVLEAANGLVLRARRKLGSKRSNIAALVAGLDEAPGERSLVLKLRVNYKLACLVYGIRRGFNVTGASFRRAR